MTDLWCARSFSSCSQSFAAPSRVIPATPQCSWELLWISVALLKGTELLKEEMLRPSTAALFILEDNCCFECRGIACFLKV